MAIQPFQPFNFYEYGSRRLFHFDDDAMINTALLPLPSLYTLFYMAFRRNLFIIA